MPINELPGDPTLPPGASLRDIDPDYPICAECGYEFEPDKPRDRFCEDCKREGAGVNEDNDR